MATAKERIQEPSYKELSALVRGTVEELRKWREKEVNRQRSKVGRSVSGESFNRYEEAVDVLMAQIVAGRKFYDTKVSHWDKTPLAWAKFPDTHKEYRELIYALENQKVLVEAEQKRMAREKAAAERPAPRPAPKAEAPKKANWWKRGVLGAALIAGGWWGAKQMSSNDAPEAGDKPGQRMEQRVTINQQAGSYTTATSDSLLDRLQQATDQSMANVAGPMDSATFAARVQGRQQRNIISGLDVQGSANQAAIANHMASTAAAKRRINYEEQRMKVDTAESWEDVSRAVSRTTRNLKDTTHEANGFINGMRDLFKRNR